MKIIAKNLLFMVVFIALFVGFAANVKASNPILAVTTEGGYGNVRIIVSNADPYSQVTLYRKQATTLWTTITNFGQTDQSGYFSATQSLGSDGSNNPVEQYVMVNGQMSNTVQTYPSGYAGGCTYNCGSPNTLSLSKTYSSLSVGQSDTITAYSYGSGIYISSNTNSSVASASASGSQINLYGLANGSITVTVCSNNYSYGYNYGSNYGCASISVNVTGSVLGANTNVWFSPSSPTMYAGQSLAVSINSSSAPWMYYGASNTYYISSNSNPSVVSASVSGTVLNLSANQSGSSSITVCHSSLSLCGTVYVTVTGGGVTGQITFSPSNPYLTAGQSLAVSISAPYLYSGSYYLSSNSNPSAVSASVSGSTLNLYGLTNGSSNISVCQNSGNCGNVMVTVSGSGGGYGNVWFNPSSLSLTTGQTSVVYVSSSNNYYGSYFVSSNNNTFAVSTSISGNQLTLTANSSGVSNITVCQSQNSSMCGNIVVTASGNSYNNSLTFSQSNVSLQQNQNTTVSVYGNGNYYVSSNSNPSAFSATVSGSTVNIYGLSLGSGSLNICQSNQYACANIYVTVSGYGYNYNNSGTLYFSTSVLPQFTLGQYYSYQLQVYGGNPPYTYQVISGQLPAGIFLSTQGQLYGTPTSGNNSSFTVRASDNFGRLATANFTVSGLSGGVLGASLYSNGQLIKESGNVYIVYKNTRSAFKNLTIFKSLGYKTGNIFSVSNSGLTDSGYTVNTANTAHPWGSWIKSGNTIYFVHESGLIPISTWEIFLNNGGDGDNIVQANILDFQRTVLSVMGMNDSRLR